MQPTLPLQSRSERTPTLDRGHHFLDEKIFTGALVRERKRADRSSQSLGLLLVALDQTRPASSTVSEALIAGLMTAKRDTDVAGWFESRKTLGLILPEIPDEGQLFADDLKGRLQRALELRAGQQVTNGWSMQFHAHLTQQASTPEAHPPVDPLLPRSRGAAVRDGIKRAVDVVGSLVLLGILAPVFLLIAALVKLKSPGPVFFKQTRVGQGMKPFTMLKFRTMHVNASHAMHHEFVTSFIKSGSQAQEAGRKGMFKIANDPRVTTIGRILRKTSLDELPQFWNVLRGDMSLVGPRPPLQYEVDQYQPWHCRRVLDAKPGITGLWQVAGRSRTTFDEMVRLDLRYARASSLWTDVKILLATPMAVFVGKGAA